MSCWYCRLTAVGACRFCGRGLCENHVETQPFVLTLDRCSGDVVRAEPLEGRPFGPYAYGGPQPRRWDRAY